MTDAPLESKSSEISAILLPNDAVIWPEAVSMTLTTPRVWLSSEVLTCSRRLTTRSSKL